jgi:DNA-binding SARP family transcriptional activator/transcriptional regulator with XRE-family HTH domain/Tfp pilus assembly protein PilF
MFYRRLTMDGEARDMAADRGASFGALLRRHRRRVGLSQRELAERAGLSVTTVRYLEQGRTRQPQPPTVRALTTALGLHENAAAALHDAAVVEDETGMQPAAAEEHGLVRLDVLGPLTLRRGSVEVALGRGGRRVVLARLALSANAPVPVHELVDLVWGEAPPPDPHQLLQSYVSRLRLALAPFGSGQPADSVVILGTGGYRLELAEQQLDVAEFRGLVRAAREADAPDAVDLLEDALRLWRDAPLADVSELRDHPLVTALVQEYLTVALRYADLASHLRAYERSLPRLRELAAAHPLHEPLHARLVMAQAGAGLQADALAAYDTIRQRLADELGIDPGVELTEAHRRVVRQEVTTVGTFPAGDRAVPAQAAASRAEHPLEDHSSTSAGPSRHVPRQLPAAPQLFTGRATELADLGKIHDASTVVITAIDGMAGVGKTALAVQAAHEMVDRYPDGQLFLDLHGYTHGVAPIEPSEALDRMLRTLGVPGERIPAGLEERAALYRSRLADQRMLVVLDNAATEAQVMPLLPGAPGCLVLVTSRRWLAGLDYTHTLSLDTLPPVDAVALFRRSVGESRVAGQPLEVLAELVELCGRLPLAIRIAAARLRSHPTWNLEHLARRLRDQQHRLVELEVGQRSVTAALDLSYHDLSADLQLAYRRLGLHPGADIEPYAVAALLDTDLVEAGRLLEQLLSAHLLQEPVPGRYRFHDLSRAHAAHTATRDDTEDCGRMALDRLLDYYRHAAAVAMDAAYPHERAHRPQVPPARTPGPVLPDPAAALNWLDHELSNLLAAARYATEHDRPTHLLQLSTIVHWHLRTRGPFHDAVTLHHQALATARATGNHAAEIEAQVRLGSIHQLLGQYAQAADHHGQALQLARATGHQLGELDALVGLGNIHRIQGRHEPATKHYQQALQLVRATGHQAAELGALAGLGHIHLRHGRYPQATETFERALWLARATGAREGELNALSGLGFIHLRHGRYEQATDNYQQTLRLARTIGHRRGEQAALNGLAQIHRIQGRYEQATEHYQQLLDLARRTNNHNYQFEAWQGLGRLQHATSHPDAALTHHQQALALATKLAQPDDQARAHDGLAHAQHALHHHEQARAHWQHALDILTRLGSSHTDEEITVATIRAHLASLAGLGRDG